MIEIRKAVKIYENGAKGLEGVTLSIQKGEFVFVVGSSGSGKSSLIRLLQKETELTSGKIFVNGEDISKITRRELPYYRRKMGVVFQDFRLLKNKTVFENVAYAMQIVEASSREIRRTVPQVLSLVGLHKKHKAYPNQLSGGEQQRTALARAIVNRPPILIADEPTGNLDPDTAWEIMTLLEAINNRGTTVVVATHAHDIVDDMQKRVVALKNGLIVHDETGGYSYEQEEYPEEEYPSQEVYSPAPAPAPQPEEPEDSHHPTSDDNEHLEQPEETPPDQEPEQAYDVRGDEYAYGSTENPEDSEVINEA